MPTADEPERFSKIRETLSLLQEPISDVSSLLTLLAGPLDCIDLLPPRFRSIVFQPLPKRSFSVRKHITSLQQIILDHIAPTWEHTLAENDQISLADQYFCPDVFFNSSPVAGEIAQLAYSTILSRPISRYSLRILLRLSREYSIDRLHRAVFVDIKDMAAPMRALTWEDCIRNVVSLPAKVANSLGDPSQIPPSLEHGTFFDHVSERVEILFFSLSSSPRFEDIQTSITYLLTKLVNVGLFPPTPPALPSQPSFFRTNLSRIRRRLRDADHSSYSSFWNQIVNAVASAATLQSVVSSLLSSLPTIEPPLESSPRSAGLVVRESILLQRLLGQLDPMNEEMFEVVSSIAIWKERDEGFARILVCWVAGASRNSVDYTALENLLGRVIEIWSSPEHIKHSILAKHHYLTLLLLLTVSYFDSSSKTVQSLAMQPALISSVGTYISHNDQIIRRCGMLVGEVIAKKAGKKLDFGDWEGNEGWKIWSRNVRKLISSKDINTPASQDDDAVEDAHFSESYEIPQAAPASSPATKKTDTKARSQKSENKTPLISVISDGEETDDSLEGYDSPVSSRAASPTPSELEEYEKDPTLSLGNKKVQRPVYLAQLGEMIKGSSGLSSNNDNQQVEKLEMALNIAEDLIRRKRDYGTELEENAVNLVFGFVGMQNNFDLEDFEVKRQAVLVALVSCCPKKSAPCIIQELYKNQYSTAQRYTMLNALAIGARELARLPLPSGMTKTIDQPTFPSKQLPPGMHKKLVAQSALASQTRQILDGISLQAIKKEADNAALQVPELARERRLKLRQSAKVQEIVPTTPFSRGPSVTTTFIEVAAEYFIMPLINRFWLYLRDDQTREERTIYLEGRSRYRGAGTGLLLSPLILSHLLATLAILVHASRTAPEWLAVIAPETLELAITIATRPDLNHDVSDDEDSNDANKGQIRSQEASLLSTSLELALVVLDGSLVLDGGRSLSLEHTSLLLGVDEWVKTTMAYLEKGLRVRGEGGAQENKIRSNLAGVLLKLDEMRSKWRRSMVDTR